MSGARARLGYGAGEAHRHLLPRTRAAARLACSQQRSFVAFAASPHGRARRPRACLCPAHPPRAFAARSCARPDKANKAQNCATATGTTMTNVEAEAAECVV